MQEWYNIGMDEQQSRLQMEVNALVAAVTRLTALSSNWNGEIALVPNADFKGKKRFGCSIELDASLAQSETRWSTLLHEVLHSFSVGYVASSYWDFPGWEEGGVEQLQRHFRPIALAELGVTVDTDVFLIGEQMHRYNAYIEALERLRLLVGMETLPFYLDLLRTPIKQRPAFTLGLGRSLFGVSKVEYVRAFSSSNAVLRTMLDRLTA